MLNNKDKMSPIKFVILVVFGGVSVGGAYWLSSMIQLTTSNADPIRPWLTGIGVVSTFAALLIAAKMLGQKRPLQSTESLVALIIAMALFTFGASLLISIYIVQSMQM